MALQMVRWQWWNARRQLGYLVGYPVANFTGFWRNADDALFTGIMEGDTPFTLMVPTNRVQAEGREITRAQLDLNVQLRLDPMEDEDGVRTNSGFVNGLHDPEDAEAVSPDSTGSM